MPLLEYVTDLPEHLRPLWNEFKAQAPTYLVKQGLAGFWKWMDYFLEPPKKMSKSTNGKEVDALERKKKRSFQAAPLFQALPPGTYSSVIAAPRTLKDHELKAFDNTNFSTNDLTTTDWTILDSSANCLFCPKQGSAENEREATRVIMKNIHFNWMAYKDHEDMQDLEEPGSPPKPHYRKNDDNYMFLALVMDTQANGLTIAPNDVFHNSSSPNVSFFCQRVLENITRFKVLKIFKVHLDLAKNANYYWATGGLWSNTYMANRWCTRGEVYLNDVNVEVNFKTGVGAGNIGDIKDNALHLIGCLMFPVQTDGEIKVLYGCRTRYIG